MLSDLRLAYKGSAFLFFEDHLGFAISSTGLCVTTNTIVSELVSPGLSYQLIKNLARKRTMQS